MKRIAQAIAVALLLIAIFALGAYAQQSTRFAPLSPFMVDIQQTIPVTFTFTVDNQPVVVPASVDVTLVVQVRADGSVSPTVQVGKAGIPQIEPTTPPAFVDNNGIPYEAHVGNGLAIEQISSPEIATLFTIAGTLRNESDHDLLQSQINIQVSMYDQDGKLLSNTFGALIIGTLPAGEAGPFAAMSVHHPEEVAKYVIWITAD